MENPCFKDINALIVENLSNMSAPIRYPSMMHERMSFSKMAKYLVPSPSLRWTFSKHYMHDVDNYL